MIVAWDLDGMLLAFPDYAKFFFKAFQDQGVKVGVLTGRPTKEKEMITKALEEVGIHPDFVTTMPDNLKVRSFPVGIFKGIVCTNLKVDVLYDDFESDDPTMMGDFFTYNQSTTIFTGFAYNPDPPKK